MENASPIENNPNFTPGAQIAQPGNAEKKSHKKLYILIASIILIIVATVVVVIMINSKKSTPEKNNNTASENSTVTDKNNVTKKSDSTEQENAVKKVIGDIKNEIEQSLLSYAAGQVKVAATISQTYNETPPYYFPAGTVVGVDLEKSFGLKIDGTEDLDKITEIANKIRTYLANSGFKRYTKVSTAVNGDTEFYNTDSNIICSPIMDSIPLAFSCGDTSWISQEKIDLSNDLAVAYQEKNNEYPLTISVSEKDVENSPYVPYQRVTANLGSFAGLFYRTSKDASWRYFTGSQATLECSAYNTEVLKRAFAGEVCIDAVGNNAPVTP